MDYNTILSSIITSASIVFAVGIPLIIYFVSNYNNRKEKHLYEMKGLYPKLNAFRELVYNTFQTDFWKNKNIVKEYENAVKAKDENKIKSLKVDNEFLHLYEAFKYISEIYSKDTFNNNLKRILTNKELNGLLRRTNTIWYFIHCRTDIKKEIDSDSIKKPDNIKLDRIKNIISKYFPDYSTKNITIETIASIAGDMEITVIDNLLDLSTYYERPIESIVKKLFSILIVSLFFGVILPLLLLLLSPMYSYLLIIIVVIFMTVSFVSMMLLTGQYIGFF